MRTRAPEVVLHTSYTEVSTLKAGSALDWGACLVRQSGKLMMVFLTLQTNPRSFITSQMTITLVLESTVDASTKVHVTESRLAKACRLSVHHSFMTVHVRSPVSKELDGDSMAPVQGLQDIAPKLLSRQ